MCLKPLLDCIIYIIADITKYKMYADDFVCDNGIWFVNRKNIF